MDNPHSDLPIYVAPPLDLVLASEWDRMPMIFGRYRDCLSLASDDDNVILFVEYRGKYVSWHVSPPTPDFSGCDLDSGTIPIEHGDDPDARVSEAKAKALEVYAAWCAEQVAA